MTSKKTIQKIAITVFVLMAFSITSLFAVSPNYIGNGMENKRLAVYSPTYKGLSTSEQAVLTDLVSIIRMNLHDYAGFSIIDAQNMERIEQLQIESEDERYDLKSSIRAGKLHYAEYEAFITVSKTGATFSLGLSITNLETGVVFAESIINRIQKISDIEESAVNALTASIVPKLGVELTAMGKYFLSSENTGNISTEQEYSFVAEEIDNLQLSLESINLQLKQYSSSSDQLDQNAIAIKAEIETQRQLTEQRLQIARQREIRLQEQRAKELEELQESQNRSQAANNKIRQISTEVEQAASQLRSQNFSSMTFIEQITVIEKEKKAYLELRDKIKREISKLQSDTEEEYQAHWKDPDDLNNYEPIEIDSSTGRPYSVPRNLLISDNELLYKRLKDEETQTIARIQSQADIQLNEILADISQKETELGALQTLNSLTTPGLFQVNSFNMSKSEWNASVQIGNNHVSYYKENITIPFNLISSAVDGKIFSASDMDGTNGRAAYTEYRDTATAYESMFRMGVPFVYLEADFTIKPMDKKHPSSYILFIHAYRLYYTNGQKLIRSFTPAKGTVAITLEPAYDIRTDAELAEEIRQRQEIARRAEWKEEVQELTDYYTKYNLSLGPAYFSVINNIGVNFSFDLDMFANGYFAMDLAAGGGFTNSDDFQSQVLMGYGFYKFLPFEHPTDVFWQYEAGFLGVNDYFGPGLGIGVGCDIPLPIEDETIFGITIKYDVLWAFGFGFTDSLSLSIGLFVP